LEAEENRIGEGSLKIGLIGCGSLGAQHAQNVDGSKDAELTALSSKRLISAQNLSGKLSSNPAVFDDYKTMLEKQELDAVLVVTPNHLHASIVQDAAEAGVHVFCEKPMALTIADCDAMNQAVDKAGVSLMIGYVRRFKNAYSRMKELVCSGRIGRPLTARAIVPRPDPPPEGKEWVMKRDSYGGLFSLYSHELDQLTWALDEVVSVKARIEPGGEPVNDVEQRIAINLEFASGCEGFLHCGNKEMVGGYELSVAGAEGELRIIRGAELWFTAPEGEPELQEVDDNNALQGEVDYFLQCIQSGDKPQPDGKDGKRTITIAMAAYEAARLGKPVKVTG
jgi:predicted dehydrogenase